MLTYPCLGAHLGKLRSRELSHTCLGLMRIVSMSVHISAIEQKKHQWAGVERRKLTLIRIVHREGAVAATGSLILDVE